MGLMQQFLRRDPEGKDHQSHNDAQEQGRRGSPAEIVAAPEPEQGGRAGSRLQRIDPVHWIQGQAGKARDPEGLQGGNSRKARHEERKGKDIRQERTAGIVNRLQHTPWLSFAHGLQLTSVSA